MSAQYAKAEQSKPIVDIDLTDLLTQDRRLFRAGQLLKAYTLLTFLTPFIIIAHHSFGREVSLFALYTQFAKEKEAEDSSSVIALHVTETARYLSSYAQNAQRKGLLKAS